MKAVSRVHICVSVGEYTREAGVRTLERKIGALCRAVAVQVAESGTEKGSFVFEVSPDIRNS